MTHQWLHVAKAEFLVQTSRFRRKRKVVLLSLLVFGVVWALYIAPMIMSMLIDAIGPSLSLVLTAIFPGLMRSAILLIWIWLLIYPISSALQEIKIGQWEIMLGNNVNTRSIMTGTFVAGIPLYGLLTLYISPVLVALFAILYKVSLIGQVIMYAEIFFVAISTLWLANLLTTAIQAKLGDSPRGNDLAKALSYLLAFLIIIPLYGLMYFAESISRLLGWNIFLLFPFTWGADLITWTVLLFNGANLPAPIIGYLEAWMGLDWYFDLLFLVIFSLGIVALAFVAADRIFKIGGFARTEKITTVRRENFALRGIRRALPGPFGVRVAMSLKDFGRKVQNITQLFYGVVLTIIMPVIVSVSAGGGIFREELILISSIMGMMLALMCGITFGGVAFLDSQDQLWIMKSAPNGVWKFIKARVAGYLIICLAISVIPSVIVTFMFGFSVLELLVLWISMYVMVCGGVLVGTGVAANNPTYDDTRSKAFGANRSISSMIIVITWMASFFALIFLGPRTGISIASASGMYLLFVGLTVPLLLVGIVTLYIGGRRMNRQM